VGGDIVSYLQAQLTDDDRNQRLKRPTSILFDQKTGPFFNIDRRYATLNEPKVTPCRMVLSSSRLNPRQAPLLFHLPLANHNIATSKS